MKNIKSDQDERKTIFTPPSGWERTKRPVELEQGGGGDLLHLLGGRRSRGNRLNKISKR